MKYVVVKQNVDMIMYLNLYWCNVCTYNARFQWPIMYTLVSSVLRQQQYLMFSKMIEIVKKFIFIKHDSVIWKHMVNITKTLIYIMKHTKLVCVVSRTLSQMIKLMARLYIYVRRRTFDFIIIQYIRKWSFTQVIPKLSAYRLLSYSKGGIKQFVSYNT